MKLDISVEKLRTRKIFVATPMYGGQCHGMYTKATADLASLTTKYGMDVKFFYLFNESLITRARNYLVDEFLRSDATHLLFLDSDIHFDPNDVMALAALADPDSDKDIVCAPYPKKCIAWERIEAAVKSGLTDKYGAQWLENIVGDFVFNPVGGQNQIAIGEPVEVLEGGTGFMMIQRRVFEKWNEAYPELLYTPDHNRSEHFDGQRKIMCYFDTVIEPVHNRYLSEDYFFCQWSRKIDIKIWMCPWMRTSHQGAYSFSGNIPAIAQVPNATHGGMLGKNPSLNMRAPEPTAGPVVDPRKPLFAPPAPNAAADFNAADVQNRAAKRRAAAIKRREEKKARKKKTLGRLESD